MRTDIVRTYKDVHSWVGILSGLALFIAFYAGAITMFEAPLQRWASAALSSPLALPPSLERTPELIDKVLAAHPEARTSYTVHVVTGPEQPARVTWTTGNRREPGPTYYAGLALDDSLQVTTVAPSPVAQLIDVLYQQVGLPLPHEAAMPIMGVIALLYAVALFSGVVALLPSLVKHLFAARIGANAKRMWLDVHNMLGLFSLPFHIVMAVTAVMFAFHFEFYIAQIGVKAIGGANIEGAMPPRTMPKTVIPSLSTLHAALPPAVLIARIERQMPGLTIRSIRYAYDGQRGLYGEVEGSDTRYALRFPTYGMGEIDTRTGAITKSDYLPGRQDGWFATETGIFALHYGSFGGIAVRWLYFLLGLAGALVFYSGNLLWIESRRKKARQAGTVEQTRATHVMGALTVGVSLGCVAGISLTLAAAKWLPLAEAAVWHSRLYYGLFLLAVAWALLRGAARAGPELLWLAAGTTALIPVSSLCNALLYGRVTLRDANLLVDAVAIVGAAAFATMAAAARHRATHGAQDSIWSSFKPGKQRNEGRAKAPF